MLLLAIANPHLKQEDREPLNDVLAVVVDDSQSQTIAGRDPRTETIRKDLEERLKAFPNLDVRWVNSTSTAGDSDRDGTMLFTDLAKGLADVPPDRLAGVIMLTDGNVHDVPQNAAALGFDAPVHALHHRQAGRVRPQARGVAGAALRPCRRRAAGRAESHREHAEQRRVRDAHHHPPGRGAEHEERARRREGRDPGQGRSRRTRTSSRSRPKPRPASSPP